LKTHRCEESLFLKKSIRKEEFCGLQYWIIRDYVGYEPLFDDHLDSIVNLKYCPYCGKILDEKYIKTHYDIPFEKRVYIYKCLKNGYVNYSDNDFRSTAFLHRFNVNGNITKIWVDFKDQIDMIKYLNME